MILIIVTKSKLDFINKETLDTGLILICVRVHRFFGGCWGLNLEPCIYYTLSLPIELSSR